MAKSRSRLKEKNFVIAGNRSWFHSLTDFVLTLFFWSYSLLVVTYFLSAAFGFNTGLTRVMNAAFNTVNQDIRNLTLLAIGMFVVFYAILYVNRFYNKKRFGSLTRRRYPNPATALELQSLNLMDQETISRLQREDYSVCETNPIAAMRNEKR